MYLLKPKFISNRGMKAKNRSNHAMFSGKVRVCSRQIALQTRDILPTAQLHDPRPHCACLLSMSDIIIVIIGL